MLEMTARGECVLIWGGGGGSHFAKGGSRKGGLTGGSQKGGSREPPGYGPVVPRLTLSFFLTAKHSDLQYYCWIHYDFVYRILILSLICIFLLHMTPDTSLQLA